MGTLLYTFYVWLYKTGMKLVSPWNPAAKSWLAGRKQLLIRLRTALEGNARPLVWMHCDSVGEFEQGQPLIEKLKSVYPGHRFLITFSNSLGYEAKRKEAAASDVFYLPDDSSANARAFLDISRPCLALFVKYRHGFFYLQELKKREVPALLVCGDFPEGPAFSKWYGWAACRMLSCFSHLFVQTAASRDKLAAFLDPGLINIGGDTRFDRVVDIAAHLEPITVMEAFCPPGCPVIVAGSTWEEDEEQLDHYANSHPEIKFILAPYKWDQERIRTLKKMFRRAVCFSEWEAGAAPVNGTGNQHAPNVLIIDHFGLLARLYRYASLCYVGGGFVDEGVHNVLEAAVYGKPVVFGPVIEDYHEAMALVDCGGGLVVDSALEVEDTFNRLLTSPEEYYACCRAAREYVLSNQGATAKIIGYIQEKRLLTS